MSGDNYGSGPMGLPIRRMMHDGRPTGYEIQFQDEWMPMDRFNDPAFQEAWFKPWQQQQRTGAITDFKAENPDYGGGFAGFFNPGGRRRGGGSVGSRAGGGGMQYDPAMIQQLIGG
jgi:hypothetical protein